jgi:hypothetical protein
MSILGILRRLGRRTAIQATQPLESQRRWMPPIWRFSSNGQDRSLEASGARPWVATYQEYPRQTKHAKALYCITWVVCVGSFIAGIFLHDKAVNPFDVCFGVRYPQYRTLSRPIGICLRGPFLRPNCTDRRTAAAPAFCPGPAKRHGLHLRSTKTRDINRAKSARTRLAFCFSWFLSDGVLAKDSAGPVRLRQPTA